MSEDHDRCFSTLVLGAFSTGVFNTNALPRINIGADVWGESSIMKGVYQRWYMDVCVFYYCRTYYKAVRVGGGGEWRTCAMRDDEPRPVWMSPLITH